MVGLDFEKPLKREKLHPFVETLLFHIDINNPTVSCGNLDTVINFGGVN